jgi:hypothetical protein
MSSTTHQLFPTLPPELRNEIYTYLQTSPVPTTHSLPLSLKTFSDKHTTVQIQPVHNGTTSLLALHRHAVQEASEYASWLRDHAVTLRIGVVFKGRLATFVQGDWDRRMEGHLRKLRREVPWLRKVGRWDVSVFFDPVLLGQGRGRVEAGGVARGMLRTFLRCGEEVGAGCKKEVNMCVSFEHAFLVSCVMDGRKLGLNTLFKEKAEDLGVEKLAVEVRMAHTTQREPVVHASPGLVLPPKIPGERTLLAVEDGVVRWTDCTSGVLVVKMQDGVVERAEVGKGEVEGEFLLMRLGEEVEG